LKLTRHEIITAAADHTVGEFIKLMRFHLDFTQIKMAAALGLSQSKLSKIESDQIEPSLSEWMSFCEITALSLEFYQNLKVTPKEP
jgi:transcriptional regulator with XRE-family HTH domain